MLDEMTGLHWARLPATTVALRSGLRVGMIKVPFTASGYVPPIAFAVEIYVSNQSGRY